MSACVRRAIRLNDEPDSQHVAVVEARYAVAFRRARSHSREQYLRPAARDSFPHWRQRTREAHSREQYGALLMR